MDKCGINVSSCSPVNLMINLLYTAKLIEEGAILLAIRPLRVGHKKVTQRFFNYEPPKQ